MNKKFFVVLFFLLLSSLAFSSGVCFGATYIKLSYDKAIKQGQDVVITSSVYRKGLPIVDWFLKDPFVINGVQRIYVNNELLAQANQERDGTLEFFVPAEKLFYGKNYIKVSYEGVLLGDCDASLTQIVTVSDNSVERFLAGFGFDISLLYILIGFFIVVFLAIFLYKRRGKKWFL